LTTQPPKNISLGAQDCFWQIQGPYTGQVSAKTLSQTGIKWVILGHSEKRFYGRETSDQVAKKLKAALRTGLRPLLCLGEGRATHQKGLVASKRFIKKQLKDSLGLLRQTEKRNIIFVYEPVWAISYQGQSRADNPVHAAQIVSFLKQVLRQEFRLKNPLVLYGGSIDAKTINGFLWFEDIYGFLVWAASLKPGQISGIIMAIGNN